MEKEEICDNCGVGGDLKGMRRITDGERVLIHGGSCIDALKSALEASQREAAELRGDLKGVIESKNFLVGSYQVRTESLSSKLHMALNVIQMVYRLQSVTDISFADEWHLQLFQELKKFEEFCEKQALARTEMDEGENDMEKIETCPTCGSHVPTYKGHFIPIFIEIIRDRLSTLEAAQAEAAELREALKKCHDELLGADSVVKSATWQYGIRQAINQAKPFIDGAAEK